MLSGVRADNLFLGSIPSMISDADWVLAQFPSVKRQYGSFLIQYRDALVHARSLEPSERAFLAFTEINSKASATLEIIRRDVRSILVQTAGSDSTQQFYDDASDVPFVGAGEASVFDRFKDAFGFGEEIPKLQQDIYVGPEYVSPEIAETIPTLQDELFSFGSTKEDLEDLRAEVLSSSDPVGTLTTPRPDRKPSQWDFSQLFALADKVASGYQKTQKERFAGALMAAQASGSSIYVPDSVEKQIKGGAANKDIPWGWITVGILGLVAVVVVATPKRADPVIVRQMLPASV